MAIRVVDDPIRHFQGETLTVPASNGTRNAYNVRPGFQEILIEPVAAMRLQLVPAIKSLLFWDDSAGRWIDILADRPRFFDRVSAESTTVLGSMTANDRLYVGTVDIIAGMVVDMGATVNSVTATLTAQYSGPSGWATLTVAADTTDVAGATLAQDGLVTLTVPTDWVPRVLGELGLPPNAPKTPRLFWQRYIVGATLTAGIILANLTPIGRIAPGTDSTTALTGGVWLKATTEYTMDISEEVGALEIIAQAASATTARVSWIKR